MTAEGSAIEDDVEEELDDDVNTVDNFNTLDESAGLDDDMVGNRLSGGTARGVLTYLAQSIATEPDAVVVEADETSRGIRFRVHVAPDDMGRVIGRRGRVAQAIRAIVRVAGSRDGVDTNVDFVDE